MSAIPVPEGPFSRVGRDLGWLVKPHALRMPAYGTQVSGMALRGGVAGCRSFMFRDAGIEIKQDESVQEGLPRSLGASEVLQPQLVAPLQVT